MGRRSRERAREAAAPPPEPRERREPEPSAGRESPASPKPSDAEKMAAAYSRSRAKDEAARAALVPLAPGERPGAVTVAAVVAVGLAIANVVALALGRTLAENSAPVSVAFSAVLLVAAWGMWRAKYWAVLGFQALLAIQIILFAFALLVADDVSQFAVSILAVGLGGWLFVKLVRAMARIQMPAR